MNMKIKELNNLSEIEKTKLLIDITNCIENARSIKDFITDARAVLQKSGLPVFSLSLATEEKGSQYLLVNADLGRLNAAGLNQEDELSELNIVRKVPLIELKEKHRNIINPLMSGIIVKTKTVEFDDDITQTRSFDKTLFLEYFFSMSSILQKLHAGQDLNSLIENDTTGELVIFPIKSGNAFVGTVDLLVPPGHGVMSKDDVRLMTLITRIIGSSYRNFMNIFRASTSESKFRAIFESTPLPIYVVDRNFQIIEANNRFKAWYPGYHEGENCICRDIMPDDEKSQFCSECSVKETLESGKAVSREIKITRESGVSYYKIKSSPIVSDNGEISAVMQTVEDITEKALEHRQIKKQNKKLELEVSQKIDILKEKEKNLRTLVDTVHGIEAEKDRGESVEKIIQGYMDLNAKAAAFVINNGDTMHVARVYPDMRRSALDGIFEGNLEGGEFSLKRNPGNPFCVSVKMVNPIFFIGHDGLEDFFESCFPDKQKKIISKAVSLCEGLSLIIFPLEAKEGAEGAIAVLAELDVLESNFEYFQLLSNSAAVEISRRKSAEALAETEDEYRRMIDSSHDMIAFCDRHGNMHLCNEAFYQKTGSSDDLSSLNLFDFFPKLERTALKKMMEGLFEDDENPGAVEAEMIAVDGAALSTEIEMTRTSPSSKRIQVLIRDVSDHKKMESQLNTIYSIHEQIIQTDMIGIVTTDLKGCITKWNIGAVKILGYTEKEVLNRNIRDFIVPGTGDVLSSFGKMRTDQPERKNSEIKLRRKNGEPVTVMYVESVMKDDRGNPIIVVAFFFDISEKISLEVKSNELIHQLSQAQKVTILALAKLTEYRDWETGSHLERIMKYTELLAHELSTYKNFKNYISDEYINDLVSSCPLHDIGKVGIPDQILHKPGKLTTEEFEIMKSHTIIGGDTIHEAEQKIKNRSYLNLGKEVAYYHHEKWDGTGYPRGLKQDEIPLSARIVAIADVYDALTSKRPYKEAFDHRKAADIIKKSARTHFDDMVVRAFIHCEKDFIQYNDIARASKNTEGNFSQEIDINNTLN